MKTWNPIYVFDEFRTLEARHPPYGTISGGLISDCEKNFVIKLPPKDRQQCKSVVDLFLILRAILCQGHHHKVR